MSYNYPTRPPGLNPQQGYETCKHCNGWGHTGSKNFNWADEDPTCTKCWGQGTIRIEPPSVPLKQGWNFNE